MAEIIVGKVYTSKNTSRFIPIFVGESLVLGKKVVGDSTWEESVLLSTFHSVWELRREYTTKTVFMVLSVKKDQTDVSIYTRETREAAEKTLRDLKSAYPSRIFSEIKQEDFKLEIT